MNLRNKFILLLTFLVSLQLTAQDTGNSPYSSLGIGDINNPGNTRNIGMGNTGISNGNSEFINILNPALLPANKFLNKDTTIRFTKLEGGFMGDYYKQSTNRETQSNGGFNIQYIAFSFPVSKSWTSSIGIRPYSTVMHKVVSIGEIAKDVYYYSEDFYKGGLNQVHFANGLDLTKNLSVGVFAGYIFGNINEEKVVQSLSNNRFSDRAGYQSRNNYNGFQFKPGIAYRIQLKDTSGNSSGVFLNAGFVYEKFLLMKGESTRSMIKRNDYGQVTILNQFLSENNSINANFPTTTSGGVSIDKPGKWTVAMDLHHSKWENFTSLESLRPALTYRNTYSIALGGEFKPAKSVTLTSKEYRAGINYSQLPYAFNGRQLNDFSVSLGSSIPLGRKDARFKSKPLTKINLALVLGTRGTEEQGLIKEKYFRVFFSALIQDKWFQRWKID